MFLILNMTTIGPVPSLIPGSENLSTAYSELTKFNKLVSDTVNIEGSTISGLIDPTTSTNSVTKNYVNNIFKINKYQTIIGINGNTTYTGQEIINGFIQRNMESQDRFDKFPTASEIITTLNNTNINLIECVIQNMSTLSENNTLSIDIAREGINIITGSSPLVIRPYSLVTLKMLITDFSETNPSIDLYYNYTFIQNLSDSLYVDQEGIRVNNFTRTTNNYSQKTTVVTLTSSTNYTAQQIINALITRTTSAGIDTFPTSSQILTQLSLVTVDFEWSFQTTIRNKTGSILQINKNTGINFDFIDPFLLDINKSVTFLFKYTGSGIFTVYILRITNFDDLCTIS